MTLVMKEEQEEDFQAEALERDSRWQLIQRIVASPSFSRSPRLSSFLLFVCKQFLIGNGARLNEQNIGEIVFERPVGYDPRDDNIVRSHATRLRARLESHFGEEGTAEILRVRIPRGTYVPSFERIESDTRADVSEVETSDIKLLENFSPVRLLPTEKIYRFIKTCLLVSLFIATVSLVAYRHFSRAWFEHQTPKHKLWSQMFLDNQDTLIVPADISLVMARLISGNTVTLSEYASGRYKSGIRCETPCDHALLQEVESRRYTSMADLEFATALSRLPEFQASRTQIRYVRDLQLEDLKQTNLIMAGSMVADPWLALIEHEMNFVLHDNPALGSLRVENKRPGPGEKAAYFFDSNDPQRRGLATISFLPNLSGRGNLLIVQGFTLAGTEAAAEFVTGGTDFDRLFAAFFGRSSPLPHFEILLETMDVNGMSARPNVLAWRTYP